MLLQEDDLFTIKRSLESYLELEGEDHKIIDEALESYMQLDKNDLITIHEALEEWGAPVDLMVVIADEIEKRELEEVDFDDDDGCSGGACKL